MNAYNQKIAKEAVRDARRANKKLIEYKMNPVVCNESYTDYFKKSRAHHMCVARKLLGSYRLKK